MLEKINKKKA